MAVVNPPMLERDRSGMLDDLSKFELQHAYNEKSIMLPAPAAWRGNWNAVGNPLVEGDGQAVRANHFKVHTNNLVANVCQYSVKIYRLDADGNRAKDKKTGLVTDIAHVEDTRFTSTMIKALKDRHTDWPAGFTYDGRSIIYTTEALDLQGEVTDAKGNAKASETENVTIGRTQTDDGKTYSVEISNVANIPTPRTERDSVNLREHAVLSALDTSLLSFARWGVIED